MLYHYDGTFAGLLTVFHRLFATGEDPEGITSAEPLQSGLFDRVETVDTDSDRAWRLFDAMSKKISPQATRTAYCAFLSEESGMELALFRYLRLGRQRGARLDDDLTHPDVMPVHRWARRVRTELHRLKGLIRFREVDDGLLYAPIEPDFNILILLAPHFAARLPEERWLIHDLRRGQGVFHADGKWRAGKIDLEDVPRDAPEEAELRRLWRRFFTEIAIPERRNPALQKKFVPVRYWRHLTEMTEEG